MHDSSTLVDVLERWAGEQPDKILYSFQPDDDAAEPVSWTYATVARRARAIAARLREGRLAGERALLIYPSGLDFVTAFLGCLYAGVVAVPVYPPSVARLNRTLRALSSIAADSTPAAILTTSEIREMVAATADIGGTFAPQRLLATDEVDDGYAAGWTRPNGLDRDTTAFLQYTSGSTGTPKGVVVSHANLRANEARISGAFGIGSDDVVLGWLPLYHDMGLIGLVLQPLYAGASGVLMSPFSFLKQPVRWLRMITRFRGTVSGAPNFAYDFCARRSAPAERRTLDLSSWSVAFNGSEPVRARTLDVFSETFAECGFRRTAFYPCYGLAESTLLVAGGVRRGGPVVTRFDGGALGRRLVAPLRCGSDPASPAGRELVGAGRAMPDHEIRIVDPETRLPCEPGRIGEIWLAGPSVAAGYWRRPELSADVFGARLRNEDGGEADRRYLRTGDLGFLHDGVLYVAGRIKDLIIIRGRNHYCQDIEQTVERGHPLIRQSRVAAFGVETADGERLVVAAEIRSVEPEHQAEAIAEVIASVRTAIIQDHDVDLHAIALLGAGTIPKTSSGKIRRAAARTAFEEGTWTTETVVLSPGEPAPRTTSTVLERDELVNWLVETVAARLNTTASAIDVRRPFMDYGMDSATSVQLVGDIEARLGRQLPATLLYDQSTIERVCEYLLGRPDSPATSPAPTRAARRKAAHRKLTDTTGSRA